MKTITIGTLWSKIPINMEPIYIGRAGKGKKGRYGNPYSSEGVGRAVCLNKYANYLKTNPELVTPLVDKVKAGEKLFFQCFCHREPIVVKEGDRVSNPVCHGEILAKAVLNKLNK